MSTLLGSLFQSLTGVAPEKAKEWAASKARAAFRNYICECKHLVNLHAQHAGSSGPDALCGGLFQVSGGPCSGVTNGERCKCARFVSLAERDEARPK